jgi:hypothetical protein
MRLRIAFEKLSHLVSFMRRSREAVEYRCAEPVNRNAFCNDQIEAERVELAQITK